MYKKWQPAECTSSALACNLCSLFMDMSQSSCQRSYANVIYFVHFGKRKKNLELAEEFLDVL